ncbi:nucleotidyl transferase AbiEii/AbiGii toxin family protein [Rhizomicrobium electricum]|uniref:Nucleotidyl transferase AbiEii/AbiGii toxin family protein n=1 Tax=Rhizomicrobium electricum TaxID=480070 RepID=A0ABP3Q7H0_9PROT|nr:nucleotidyl transferase AbiEii/AbiGii toxin family protein [Rhizomicrobium electricum]NIJ46712.1 putative nucleotidyltransferase component of viral defense system [Rhizomicrobium electricum]
MNETYRAQVRLLLDVLPLIAEEDVFALKGGTAINLFERDLPRLSVDIDLTYLPLADRDTALSNIAAALTRIKGRIEASLAGGRTTLVHQEGGLEVKLQIQRARTQIKVEVNPTLRGALLPIRTTACAKRVEDMFEAFVEMPVLAHGELFGGKICAALDRQHPRDLFDVRYLLDEEGLTDDVKYGMIAALASHNRPIAELLAAHLQDRQAAFNAEFSGMTLEPFDYDCHQATFERLRHDIHAALNTEDRAFLMSFEAGEPDFSLFPLPGLQALPAVQWKLLNIRKLKQSNPTKHAKTLTALKSVLSNTD